MIYNDTMQSYFLIKTKSIFLYIVIIGISIASFIACADTDENKIIKIKTWEDFALINTNPSGHFKLMKNLSHNREKGSVNNTFTPLLLTQSPLNEIYSGEGFTGIFDGNGKSIEGIYISSSASFIGLFASVGDGAVIQNLTLKNITIQGRHFLGALAGEIKQGAMIKNVVVMDATIMSTSDDGKNIGGITGENRGELFVNFSGSVSGNENVGGVAGYNYGGIHTKSHAIVVQGMHNVGGLIGYNKGAVIGGLDIQRDIQNESSEEQTRSQVEGISNIGGAVGYNEGSVNTFIYADIKGASNVGGIAGISKKSVAGVFQGSVEGKNTTGGMIGENSGSVIGIVNGIVLITRMAQNDMALYPFIANNTSTDSTIIVYWNNLSIQNDSKKIDMDSPENDRDKNTHKNKNTSTTMVIAIPFSGVDAIEKTSEDYFVDTKTQQALFRQKAFQNIFMLPEKSKQLPTLKAIDFTISDDF